MATLKRSHTPMPWGAQVEKTVWERSRSGKPRRRRSDRPPLTNDPGWDWDGTRILFNEKSLAPDSDEEDCACEFQAQLREDAHYPTLLARTHATLSLFDIARSQATKSRRKARSSLDDFEVIRVPNVVPVLEEEADLGDSWELREWETFDGLGLKRTYSEVAQGFVDGKDPPNTPGCSRLDLSLAEDDSWECL